MISISTRADKNGFWYLIDVPEDCSFTLSYIVIGAGGRQSSGEVKGNVSNTRQWQFQHIGFPVLRVGITDMRINEQTPNIPVTPNVQLQADSLSRRKAIRTFATTFLAGSTMFLFPSSSSSGQTQTALEELSKPSGSYNPYGDDSTDSFNPY